MCLRLLDRLSCWLDVLLSEKFVLYEVDVCQRRCVVCFRSERRTVQETLVVVVSD